MKIIKGPYLQFKRPEELIVLWETDAPGPSRVDYGPTAEFGHHVDQTAPTTLHRVLLQTLGCPVHRRCDRFVREL